MPEHIALLRSPRPGTRLLGARAQFDAITIEASIFDNLPQRLCESLVQAFIVEPFVDVRLALVASLREHAGYNDSDLPEVLRTGGLADMCLDDPDEMVVVSSIPVVLGLVPGVSQHRCITRALASLSAPVRIACLYALEADEERLADHHDLVRHLAEHDANREVRAMAAHLVSCKKAP